MSGGNRVVHQDYIVKQRYHNTLPPPPGAPKLLKIPIDPMATYLSPFYTERMRRAEPMNIEADAFLGMPIDLVGMPGVFDGDERAIQAPLTLPPVHPRDRALLRPLKALGRGAADQSDISFLRRTQYVANEDRARSGGTQGGLTAGPAKKRRLDVSKEDASHILRTQMKAFDLANASSTPSTEGTFTAFPSTKEELEAWNKPKHPSKPHLKVLDSYPLLPDLDGLTNAPDGSFSLIKFMGNPSNVSNHHDERLDVAVLRSIIDEYVLEDYQTRMRAHLSNPAVTPRPQPPAINFELFVSADADEARALKRKRDIDDDDRDAEDLNTSRGQDTAADQPNDVIKLRHARNYESGLQTEHEDPYQEVGLALHDPETEGSLTSDRLIKAAYFYPISAKTQIKPRRKTGRTMNNDEEAQVDEVDLRFRDADVEERERRETLKAKMEGRAETVTATNGAGSGGARAGEEDADGDEE